jgi:predicted aldo/keto reductase-like oxidoreductase
MRDNLSYMEDFKPLTEAEFSAVWKVRDIFNAQKLIPCTECRYCMEVCPLQIPIPNFFASLNDKKAFNNSNAGYYYSIHSKNVKASECIKCGKCEAICPQHLKIRDLLVEVAKTFEK